MAPKTGDIPIVGPTLRELVESARGAIGEFKLLAQSAGRLASGGFEALSKATRQFAVHMASGGLDTLVKSFGQAAAAIASSGRRGLGAVGRGVGAAGRGALAAGKGAASLAGKGLSALANVAGLAATSLSALGGIGGQIAGFVEALNPAAAQFFAFTMKDLAAVVGTALMPVLTVFTEAVRETADTLYPIAQQLAPIFGEIASVVLATVKPMLYVFAEAIKAVMPLLTMWAQSLAAQVPLFEAAGMLLQTGLKLIGELFKSLLGDNDGSAFKTAMQNLASAAILAAASLAKMATIFGGPLAAGANKFLDTLIDVVGKKGVPDKKDTTGLGAASNAQVKGLGDFGRSQLSAAFIATPMEDKKKTKEEKDDEWKAKLLKELQGIKDIDLKKTLMEKLDTMKNEIVAAIDRLQPTVFGPQTQRATQRLAVVGGDPIKAAAQAAWDYLTK